jgi:hypothetical protein
VTKGFGHVGLGLHLEKHMTAAEVFKEASQRGKTENGADETLRGSSKMET